MKSRSASIETLGIGDLDIDKNRAGRNGSPTWVIKIFFPERTTKGEMLEGTPEEKVESLVNKLKGARII